MSESLEPTVWGPAARHVMAVMPKRLAAGKTAAHLYQEPGATSRGGRGVGRAAEADARVPSRIVTAWVGRLELRPTS